MSYTLSDLKQAVKGRIYNKTDMLSDYKTTFNMAVREVFTEIDPMSSKRKASSPSRLYTDVYSYACPTDLKGQAIVDIQPQVNRSNLLRWRLVPEVEFDVRKFNTSLPTWSNWNRAWNWGWNGSNSGENLVCVASSDGTPSIKASIVIDDNTENIGTMNSLTADGGTWALFGDGTNLTVDTDNFVHGSASINWDISAAGGTTAGIQNTSLNSHDISSYLSGGAAFVWVYITSTTNITNFKLRLGSSSTVYHEWTITTNNEGVSFVTGWNLLRFQLQSPTDTGVPTDTAITYAAVYMTKAAAKISETDYRFDWLVAKNGEIFNIIYYSKYGWQSATGTWKENATLDSDILNVDTDEYGLVIEKAVELAALEVREDQTADMARKRYEILKAQYKGGNYKSEALRVQTQYHKFGTIRN